jgi:hypothetical protein
MAWALIMKGTKGASDTLDHITYRVVVQETASLVPGTTAWPALGNAIGDFVSGETLTPSGYSTPEVISVSQIPRFTKIKSRAIVLLRGYRTYT